MVSLWIIITLHCGKFSTNWIKFYKYYFISKNNTKIVTEKTIYFNVLELMSVIFNIL